MKAVSRVFALVVLLAAAVQAGPEKLLPELKAWLEDVSPILTKTEREVFLDLQTNAERQKFVQLFWRYGYSACHRLTVGRPHQDGQRHGKLLFRPRLMGTLVGSSAAVSTWGKFRCLYGRNTSALTIYDHSADYANGFKSAADGSGLIRINRSTVRSALYYQPTFRNFWTDIPDNENVINIFGGSQSSPIYPATVQVETELTGETMTLDYGSVTIVSSLFSAGAQQTDYSGSDLGTVLTIGKLTAF